MSLIIAGIDEAGYGPLLGPLCMGLSVWRLHDWDVQQGAPDLWKLLDDAVCRKASDSRRRIAIDDSKKLKLANSSVNHHPLTHLERGVLTCLRVAEADPVVRHQNEGSGGGEEGGRGGGSSPPGTTTANSESDWAFPQSDLDLLSHLHTRPPPTDVHRWYDGPSRPVPITHTSDQIAIAANTLRRAMHGAGVELLAMRCRVIGETAFNELVEHAGSKAAATEHGLGWFLRGLWERWATVGRDAEKGDEEKRGEAPRVVCDRQGGRVEYAEVLQRLVPGAAVEILEESARASRYRLHSSGEVAAGGREMTILFMSECESRHLPVALASMIAKYIRELMMARFNAYWSGLCPELKPTAGYTLDARRWLRDAAGLGILDDDARAVMVRRA